MTRQFVQTCSVPHLCFLPNRENTLRLYIFLLLFDSARFDFCFRRTFSCSTRKRYTKEKVSTTSRLPQLQKFTFYWFLLSHTRILLLNSPVDLACCVLVMLSEFCLFWVHVYVSSYFKQTSSFKTEKWREKFQRHNTTINGGKWEHYVLCNKFSAGSNVENFIMSPAGACIRAHFCSSCSSFLYVTW